jgi:hypothetical protein
MATNGGGIGSRVVKEVGMQDGRPAYRISEGGASQIGSSMGNHTTGGGKVLNKAVTPLRDGMYPANSVGGQKLGNELARNVGAGGAGAGREVMRSGSQHGTPMARGNGSGRDILGGFGPESKRR